MKTWHTSYNKNQNSIEPLRFDKEWLKEREGDTYKEKRKNKKERKEIQYKTEKVIKRMRKGKGRKRKKKKETNCK